MPDCRSKEFCSKFKVNLGLGVMGLVYSHLRLYSKMMFQSNKDNERDLIHTYYSTAIRETMTNYKQICP